MKAAAPLIRFLKTKRVVGWGGSPELIFGNLGERVEHAVQNYVNAPPPITARGRPGDSWLAGCIFVLAGHLMYGDVPEDRSGGGTRQRSRRRLSEKGTIRAIERLLKRAGHGEVVTKEKIRHVMRRERPVMRAAADRLLQNREDQGRSGKKNPGGQLDAIAAGEGSAFWDARRPRLHPGITQEVAPNESQRAPNSLA
ncbi:MAG: hypothetical protein ACRD1B_05445 [Thermoanaerobaculia bacterium]